MDSGIERLDQNADVARATTKSKTQQQHHHHHHHRLIHTERERERERERESARESERGKSFMDVARFRGERGAPVFWQPWDDQMWPMSARALIQLQMNAGKRLAELKVCAC